jgi:hypothetical protein
LVTAVATAANAQSIEEIQAAIDEAGAEWTAGPNEAAFMHREYGWYTPSWDWPVLTGTERRFQPLGLRDVPSHLDWRDIDGKDYVTRVKNQLSCGSCWAFATTGPIESHILIQEDIPGEDINLSEQQFLSCCNLPGCASGCNGGFTTSSFDFARDFGLFDEDCLPYGASDSIPCDERCDDWQDRLFQIDSWDMIGEGIQGIFPDPQDMIEALQIGPLGTSLTIYDDFFDYASGIYETVIDWPLGFHAVTIVGYDSDQEYWICKNSWGASWGEDGFFRIKWRAAQIGMFTILPQYTAQGLDDDDDTSGDDDDNDDNDDNDNDEPPPNNNKGDDDDSSSGC